MTECDMIKRMAEIERMAKVLCRSTITCNRCLNADHIRCDAIQFATWLYDADYHKTDEVRKETLQKLFKAIKESGRLLEYSETINLDDLWEIIDQEFGIEVEE